MTETLTREDVELHTGLGPGDVAHIVNQRKHNLTEAYVLGIPVVALCGYEWIPTKSPDKLPICEECKRIFAQQGGSVAS
jgi:hypothetical protein